ncbi:MAG: FliO/MopB family protein [Solirubrobacterales bacterium]|nr:FliO/MopB family protein [Solirubrobacterales bacterium]
MLLAPAWALAADPYGEDRPLDLPADSASSKADTVGSGGGSLVRTFVGLAVVVAVIYGLTWVLKQMKAAKEDRASGFGLSSEATIPLGPGRSVHLIRAGRELVLVGSAEQGVVPIRTYTEDEAAELGLLRAPADDEERPSAGAGKPAAAAALTTFVEKLRERTVR